MQLSGRRTFLAVGTGSSKALGIIKEASVPGVQEGESIEGLQE